ncbi:hypothetical protein M885DRAFT_533662 [Pelagophyceae sp. CCMP2097]|nr:hypothetical protein M885DRAFT_533662 [Pelagophyceae sp. CCMP2097]
MATFAADGQPSIARSVDGDVGGVRAVVRTVVFVDCPDPDNALLVLVAARRGALDVVLTGRPADLSVATRRFSPLTCRSNGEAGDEAHSKLVLRAYAAFLTDLAAMHGIYGLRLYDGGAAPVAPVAHAEHVQEWLFGRPDLGEPEDEADDCACIAVDPVSHVSDWLSGDWRLFGAAAATPSAAPPHNIVDFQQYTQLLARLNREPDGAARAKTARRWIESGGRRTELLPLQALGDALENEPWCAFVGGPLTALRALLKQSEARRTLTSVRAMFASWDCSTANLFSNQFNVACDVAAAQALLSKGPEQLKCPVRLFTTEFCKEALTLSPAQIARACSPQIDRLYRLWDCVTGNRHALVLFDVSVALDAAAPGLVQTEAVECSLCDDGVFRLSLCRESNIVATPLALPNASDVTTALVRLLKEKAPAGRDPL